MKRGRRGGVSISTPRWNKRRPDYVACVGRQPAHVPGRHGTVDMWMLHPVAVIQVVAGQRHDWRTGDYFYFGQR